MQNLDEQSSRWRTEFEEINRQTCSDAISFSVPLLVLGGIISGGWLADPDPFRGVVIGVWFGLLAVLLLITREWRLGVSAWLLVLGSLAGILLLIVWAGHPEAAPLLLLPLAIAVLLFPLPVSVGVGVFISLLIFFLPLEARTTFGMRMALTILAWSIVWILWLSRQPLFSIGRLAWEGYERSRDLLEQSRDYQLKLGQTLEDLKFANQQLERMNRLANNLRLSEEEARRAKEEFVANVSHELRTPLNMIIGFTENIVDAPESYGIALPAPLLADLTVVLRNSQHLSELVDDVLDMSQIESGKMAITKEWIDIGKIIAEAVTAIRPLYDSKGLSITLDLAPSIPAIMADPTRMREVLLNLLSNAGRFTLQGGVTLRLWKQAAEVVVSVSDTGPGIKTADINRLFQPFQQLDATIRRKFGGTGLGLAISRSFVEMHDGRMWVDSQEGQGTTFFFSLPIQPEVPSGAAALQWIDPAWPLHQRVRPSMAPVTEIRPRMVLCETGSTLARLLTRYFSQVEIIQVPNLEAAAAELKKVPAQAVLVNAPTLEETLTQVRNGPSLPDTVPVLAFAVPNMSLANNLPGIADYLVKPVSRQVLIETLEKLPLKGKTLLVVDDEPESVRLYRRILAAGGQGYRVLTARDGGEALDILRQHTPDCIITDLVMPEMDGFQLLAEKEKDPALRDIPVIVVTAQDASRQPILSKGLTVLHGHGLTLPQMLACIEAISSVFSRPPGYAHPAASAGDRA